MSRFGFRCLLGVIAIFTSEIVGAEPVGRLAGAVAVSDMGQPGYSIPIQVPKGAAGMTPSVSLVYSGSTARGLLGVGWSLSGISAITRCPKVKVLDVPIDGAFNKAMALDATDKLCLDGTRLIGGPLNAATTYRTELQQYSKISAVVDSMTQQPLSLTVVTSQGVTLRFGISANTRISVPFRSDGLIVAWLLEESVDINGNKIRYFYDKLDNNVAYVPKEIWYTENSSISPALAVNHKIFFDYVETYHDVPVRFIGDGRNQNNKLLSSVRVQSKNAAGSFAEVRRYDLTYRKNASTSLEAPSTLTKRPLLAAVTMCSKGACLKPTKFTWSDSAFAFSTTATNGPALGANFPDGTTSEQYFSTIQYVDFNGDGLTDICMRASTGIVCHASTGTGFGAAVNGPAWSDTDWSVENRYATIRYADINADGKLDVCGRAAAGMVCYLGTGSGFDLATAINGPAWSDSQGWGSETERYYLSIVTVDLNHDGRSDFCGIGPHNLTTGVICYYTEQSGSSFSFTPAFFDETGTEWEPDINKYLPSLTSYEADGNNAAEVCFRANQGGGVMHLYCIVPRPGSGVGVVEKTSNTSNIYFVQGDWRTFRMTDVNGDGHIDHCLGSLTYYRCLKNTGQMVDPTEYDFGAMYDQWNSQTSVQFSVDQSVGFGRVSMSPGSSSTPSTAYYATLNYVDINSDGAADVCERGNQSFRCFTQQRVSAVDLCLMYNPQPPGGCSADNYLGYQYLFLAQDQYVEVFNGLVEGPAWSDSAGWNAENRYRTIGLADINGDGRIDVCGRESSGIKCYTGVGGRDVITAIEDGYGVRHEFDYKPLTDSSVYTKGTTAIAPDFDLQPAFYVVSESRSSNGVGGMNAVRYSYGGLKTNMDRGSLGFAWREVRDIASLMATRTDYFQGFPYTGMPQKTEARHCAASGTAFTSCTLLSRKTTEVNQKSVMPSPYQGILPYIERVTEESWSIPSVAP